MNAFSRAQHLIAIVLAGFLFGGWWVFHRDPPPPERPGDGAHLAFVEVLGYVARPGVYWFTHAPSLTEAVSSAGGLKTPARILEAGLPDSFASGTRLHISTPVRGTVSVHHGEMSAHKRVALGIPLDVNRADREELELLPYVGPQQAAAIVELRGQKGGLKQMEDLLAVKGIGPETLKKLEPWLKVDR
jgi:competence protein ComEA